MKEIISWSTFILPLLSLFFLGGYSLQRFMPVALFVTVLNTIIFQAAYHYNWWRETGLFEWDKVVSIHWVYSAYLIATLWIFKFTYGKFWAYFIVNIVLDGIYSFLLYPFLQELGMASGKMPSINSYLIMIAVSLVIYLYQVWQEKIFVHE